MQTEITINTQNRTCFISAPVDCSLNASLFADRLDKLPYLKVVERKYQYPNAKVYCHTIKGLFTIEKLHYDLDNQFYDIILPSDDKN